MPTEEQVRSAVDGYVEHLNARRRDEWLARFASSATVVDPVPSDAVVGLEAIGVFFDGLTSMADRLEMTPRELHVCADRAALVYSVVAGPAAGGGVTFDGVAIFTVDDDGLITEAVAYWEPSQIRPVDDGAAPA